MLISNSKRLLEFIKNLIQLINFDIVLVEIIELSHINRLLNVIVEKNDFDVYLFHVLIQGRCQGKDRLITYKLDH